MKIEELTDEELVELITEILDSPRAFKLLGKIPISNCIIKDEKKRIIGIRTKTKYVNKRKEYRDYTPYWISRLLDNPPTHFYKHNQHGMRSPLFKIIYLDIVDSPMMYLEEGILHTEKAILIIGVQEKNENR